MTLKKSYGGKQLVLMVSSMVVLCAFLSYWLWQSYLSEKRNTNREMNYVMMSTIRSVEDSLLRHALNDTIVKMRVFDRHHHLKDSMITSRIRLRSNDTSRVKVTVIPKDENSRKHFSSRRFPGMIGLYLQQMATELRDTTMELEEQTRLLLHRAFEQNHLLADLPESTRLRFNEDSTASEVGLSSFVFRDELASVTAKVWAPVYRGFVLRKMLLQILIALGLAMLTFVTLVLLYRNLIRQQRLIDARADLVSNMTHELNTPITTAGLALQVLRNDVSSNLQTKEYAGLALKELDRLNGLIDKMMFGLSASQPDKSNRQKIDLYALTREVLKSSALLIKEANGQVHFNDRASEAFVLADQMELTGVLQNLIDNALKYSAPTPVIDIAIQSDAAEISWAITDNGVGIDKAYHEQVFDQLFRVPVGNVHNVKGYGIGLHLVKKIIEQHGGKVSLRSALGKGTTVTIKLKKAK